MILTFMSDPNAFNCRFTVNAIIDAITVIWWSSSGIKLEMQFQSCVVNCGLLFHAKTRQELYGALLSAKLFLHVSFFMISV